MMKNPVYFCSKSPEGGKAAAEKEVACACAPPVQVSVLIRYLLSMRGRRLWAYEDSDPSTCPPANGDLSSALPSAAALSAMVTAVHEALAFEPSLKVRLSCSQQLSSPLED